MEEDEQRKMNRGNEWRKINGRKCAEENERREVKEEVEQKKISRGTKEDEQRK